PAHATGHQRHVRRRDRPGVSEQGVGGRHAGKPTGAVGNVTDEVVAAVGHRDLNDGTGGDANGDVVIDFALGAGTRPVGVVDQFQQADGAVECLGGELR